MNKKQMPEQQTTPVDPAPGSKSSPATGSNSPSATSVAVFTFGVGGHAEQARRVIAQLKPAISRKLLLVTESEQVNWQETAGFTTQVHTVRPLRDKHNRNILAAILSPLKRFVSQLRQIRALIRHNKPEFILSTGPGIALPVVLLGRIHGVHTIHIETWSRFTTRSLTGRLMYRLADEFWVQNKELLALYPNAEYVGRL